MKVGTTENEPGEGPPFIASEEWIDDFERQSTANGFETKIKRFARMQANMVALTGRRIDEFYVEELVSDAVADTLSTSCSRARRRSAPRVLGACSEATASSI